MLYKDYEGNEVEERLAKMGVEQMINIREYTNKTFEFVRDTSDLSEELKEQFNKSLNEYNNLLDYCSPKGEDIRLDPETYSKLQNIGMPLITLFNTKDEAYFYKKGVEYAKNHKEEHKEMVQIMKEIEQKYYPLEEA